MCGRWGGEEVRGAAVLQVSSPPGGVSADSWSRPPSLHRFLCSASAAWQRTCGITRHTWAWEGGGGGEMGREGWGKREVEGREGW